MSYGLFSFLRDLLCPRDMSQVKRRYRGGVAPSGLWRSSSHARLYGSNLQRSRKRIALAIDLDETLVHSSTRPTDYDFIVNVYGQDRLSTFYVNCRPHLQEFLDTVCQWYDVSIFTASKRLYADPVIDRIDRKGMIRQRFYRDSCTEVAGCFVKDLSKVKADSAKVMLIDNSPVCFSLCQDNAVAISGWVDDPNDTALLDILPFLEQMQGLRDVRSVLQLRDRAATLNFKHTQTSSHGVISGSSESDESTDGESDKAFGRQNHKICKQEKGKLSRKI
eukprot:g1118.t1